MSPSPHKGPPAPKPVQQLPQVAPSINHGHELSTQLQELETAMWHDTQAGQAAWTLYETQKKLIASCNAFEKLITFRMEHFVLTKGDQYELQLGILSLDTARRFLRGLGPGVVQRRHPWYVFDADGH